MLGADLTPAILTAAAQKGRTGLLLADACRLPLPAALLDGIFSAGLVDHIPDPAAALREWARVTAPGGVLLLFHPSGRAERAARHGRPPTRPCGSGCPAWATASCSAPARASARSRAKTARAIRTPWPGPPTSP